jgi:hypothetical protein
VHLQVMWQEQPMLGQTLKYQQDLQLQELPIMQDSQP